MVILATPLHIGLTRIKHMLIKKDGYPRMELFCRACDCNHSLTTEETERVLYALEAYICDGNDSLVCATDPDGAMVLCLLETYKTTRIENGYMEYADTMTALRLARRKGPTWDRKLGAYINVTR